MNARPITWPTVPKGKDRVRVCLHAGNSREEVYALAMTMVEWARGEMQKVADNRQEQKMQLVGPIAKL